MEVEHIQMSSSKFFSTQKGKKDSLVNLGVVVPVVLEDLKAIDIQQTNDTVILGRVALLEKTNKKRICNIQEKESPSIQ